MKANSLLFLKGIILGIANIIPGVSGGTLAITLGLYEQIIGCITHFFKNFKENLKFLLPLIIGAGLAILLLSKLITFTLTNYEVETILFFIGLILGGVPILLKKVSPKKVKPQYVICFLITFGLVLALALITPKDFVVSLTTLNLGEFIKLVLVGIVAAATMVIPGISGSFMLMMLGYYKPIVATISDLTNFANLTHNLLVLVPFGIGVVLGIFLIAKLIEYLLQKFEIPTYYAILGFVLSSTVSILIPITNWNVLSVSIGLVLCVIGYFISYKMSKMK